MRLTAKRSSCVLIAGVPLGTRGDSLQISANAVRTEAVRTNASRSSSDRKTAPRAIVHNRSWPALCALTRSTRGAYNCALATALHPVERGAARQCLQLSGWRQDFIRLVRNRALSLASLCERPQDFHTLSDAPYWSTLRLKEGVTHCPVIATSIPSSRPTGTTAPAA